jgi:hypothetical protein
MLRNVNNAPDNPGHLHREKMRKYMQEYRKKQICDMDCLNCKYPDCINNKPATAEERKTIAMFVDLRTGRPYPKRGERNG